MFDLQPAIHSHSLWTIPELGLDPRASTKEIFSAFADRSEGVILRQMTLPAGALLFLTVPEDPHSGALHLFDCEKGEFSLLEFEGENNGQLGVEDFERLARQYQHCDQPFQARFVTTFEELGLEPDTATDQAILAFLNMRGAVASRWVQFPSAVLLFVTGSAWSAVYLLDRLQGIFYSLDFASATGKQLTIEDYEQLVRQHRLFDLARHPWRLRRHILHRKPLCTSFASLAGIE